MEQFDYMRLVYLALLAIAIGGLVYSQFKGRLGEALRTTVAWVMIFLGVISIYGLWDEIRDEIVPNVVTIQSEQEILLQRQADGHFYINLAVNGYDTTFLVDTGATEITLTHDDAVAAGINLNNLRYSGLASTANGMVRTSQILLEELALQDIFVRKRVRAFVTSGEMDISLLGQSYLSLFDKVIIDGDVMTLQL